MCFYLTGGCKTKYTGPMFKKGTGFLSPRAPKGSWNSKTLFARRTLVSPVATVLPQRQQTAPQILAANMQTVELTQDNLSAGVRQQVNSSQQANVQGNTSLQYHGSSRNKMAPVTLSSVEATETRRQVTEDLHSTTKDRRKGPKRGRKKGRGSKKKKSTAKNAKCKALEMATEMTAKGQCKGVGKPEERVLAQSTQHNMTNNVFEFGDDTSGSPTVQKPFLISNENTSTSKVERLV
mgnify:CR=1 FL=1